AAHPDGAPSDERRRRARAGQRQADRAGRGCRGAALDCRAGTGGATACRGRGDVRAETRIAQLGAVSIALDRAAASIRGARDPGADLTRRSSGACHRAAVAADEPGGAAGATIAATARGALADAEPTRLGTDPTGRAKRQPRTTG